MYNNNAVLNSELLNDEVKKLENERADQMKDRIKPLPESSGMDEEQLKQLCRELHAAIDKVKHIPCIPLCYHMRYYRPSSNLLRRNFNLEGATTFFSKMAN